MTVLESDELYAVWTDPQQVTVTHTRRSTLGDGYLRVFSIVTPFLTLLLKYMCNEVHYILSEKGTDWLLIATWILYSTPIE